MSQQQALAALQILKTAVTDIVANIADFDDPNIDFDNAVVGVLGEHGCEISRSHSSRVIECLGRG